MRILFDDLLPVHYGFAFVTVGYPDCGDRLIECRGGQSNGLCGAAEEDALSLVFGTHTGPIPLRIEVWPTEPPVDDAWEEVVEASLLLEGAEPLILSAFDSGFPLGHLLAGTYRVRFCASGMDAARQQDTVLEDEEAADRYLLQLWPDDVWRPDRILRQTSETAGYWHRTARETPAPPSRAERQAAEEAARAEARRQGEAAMHAAIPRVVWGDGTPSERLLAVGGRSPQVFQRDAALAERLAALDPEDQRSLALWCARTAVDRAGRSNHPRVKAGLRSLEAGNGLPPDLASWDTAPATLSPTPPGPRVATVTVVVTDPSPAEPNLHPDYQLAFVLLEAADPDPGRAALGAVEGLLMGQHPYSDPREIWAAIDRRRT